MSTPEFTTESQEAEFWISMGMSSLDDTEAQDLMTRVRHEVTWDLVKLLRAHGHESAARLLDSTLPPPPE
ncbi:hypothetical protein ACIO3O_40065 [Streptomyces sp. NPDC087440]|uniref:hypothetical protein n=1 Tax=Streptomyces sp. NPDC087440 TaxID=3365790 RepID=UPI0037F3A493